MSKNIQCLSCKNVIAKELNNKIVFSDLKAISIVELDLKTNERDCKCRCGTWNSFDSENNQIINYKRKSEDALFNAERVVYKRIR